MAPPYPPDPDPYRDHLYFGPGPDDWPTPEEVLDQLTIDDAPPDPLALGERQPSGWLAWDLDLVTADPRRLTDAQLVDAVVGWDRTAAWASARQARVLAEFSRRRPGDEPQAIMERNPAAASRWAPDEIGLALKLCRGAAMVRLDQAARLCGLLAPTLELLEQGRVDSAKARAICDTTAFLPTDVAAKVQARVLPKAPEQTLAQLRAALARAVIAADPRGAAERHRAAARQRRVRLTEHEDGMASLWALLTAPDAVACYEWLNRLARSLGADDPRTMDARRADLLTDLLTGRLELHDPDNPTDNEFANGEPANGEPAAGSAAESVVEPRPAGPAGAEATVGAGPSGPVEAEPATEPVATGPADAVPADAAPADAAARPDAHRAAAPPTTGAASNTDPDTGSAAGTTQGDPVHRPHPEPDRDPTSAPTAAGAHPEPGPQRGRCGPRPPAAGKPLVHITMPYTTLIGADDQPCELAGYGPIPADLARTIAADAVWKRLVTDPLSGAILDHGRSTYRPPAALAEFVRARDQQCRFPTCRRQADNCELDHIQAWADGGTTADHNLALGCPQHHHTKHQPGWTVWAIRDGVLEWITPTGHHYFSSPHDHQPANDPDPPLPRRPPGKDPVPEHLRNKPAPTRKRAKPPPGSRLNAAEIFGRPGTGPPPDPDDPPPF